MTVEGHTILLVDDNDDLREVTVELLEAMGHRIIHTMRAQTALRIFDERADEIDLAILEVVLPTMSGVELAEQLRTRKPGVGVLLISTHDNHGDLRTRIDRRELAFLRKPYTGEELAGQVEAALETVARPPIPAARGADTEVGPSSEASESSDPPETLSQPRQPGRRRPKPGRFSREKRRSRVQDLVRSVAAGLGVFGVLFTLHLADRRPPSLPDQVPDSVSRGVRVVPISPVGEVDSLPRELRWRPVANAGRYEVRLLAVDESTIWRSSTDYPRWVLPEELQNRLHPRVVYFWTIEAFDEDGSRLSGSERIRFVVGDRRAS